MWKLDKDKGAIKIKKGEPGWTAKPKFYASDFETTNPPKTSQESPEVFLSESEVLKLKYEKNDISDFIPEVYAWSIKQILLPKKIKSLKSYDSSFQNYGVNILSFLEHLDTLKDDSVIYFHNGSKFDFLYILRAISILGYKEIYREAAVKTVGYKIVNILNKGKSKIFSLTITNATGVEITFKDTVLNFPSSLKGYGITLNKHFNTEIYTKLDLDGGYDKSELYNTVEELESDSNELEYLKRDVEILGTFIEFMNNVLPISKWKLTAAGTASTIGNIEIAKYQLSNLIKSKRLLPVFKNKRLVKNLYIHKLWNASKRRYTGKKVMIKFNPENGSAHISFFSNKGFKINLFTWEKLINVFVFDRYELGLSIFNTNFLAQSSPKQNLLYDQYLREAFKGGLTMSNGKYANKVIKNALYLDVNTMYSSVRNQHGNLFPVGRALLSKPSGPHVTLFTVKVKKHIINKNGIPFMPVSKKVWAEEHTKKGKIKSVYKTESNIYNKVLSPAEFILTDVEVRLLKKYYTPFKNYSFDECVEITPDIYFKAIEGRELYWTNASKFYELKKSAESPAERIAAKLILNSFWGKSAQRFVMPETNYNFSKNDWDEPIGIADITPEEYKEKLESENLRYLPSAIWTTAYAREKLISAVGNKFDKIIMMDTDSLVIKVPDNFDIETPGSKKYIEKNFNMKVHHNELGAWDIEHKIASIMTRKAKQYMMIDSDGKKFVKYAGLYLNPSQTEALSYELFNKGMIYVEQLTKTNHHGVPLLQNSHKIIKNSLQAILPDHYNGQGLLPTFVGDIEEYKSQKGVEPLQNK